MKSEKRKKRDFTRDFDRFFSNKTKIVISKEELEQNPALVVTELLAYIANKKKSEEGFPTSIFSNTKLTVFEAIVKFLREEKEFTYHYIGKLVDRKKTTISTTYFRAQEKLDGPLPIDNKQIIPFSEFKRNPTYSPLEVVVSYLHKTHQLSFTAIARTLKRDSRTIWTVYHRATLKGVRP